MKFGKDQIKNYFREDFRRDLIAGIVVGLVALPLAIAFAIASGVKPEQGIYSAIIAGFIMAALSGSSFQVSGPTGAFIVILLGIVNQFGVEGLLVSGFMAGIILVLMGVFKFGSVIKFIPYPVIVGFTSGIAVTIFTGQIKNFFGLSFDHTPHGFVETVAAITHAIHGTNYYAILIGLITLIVLIIWGKYTKKIPPAPAALLVGTLLSLFFIGKLPVVGNIPSGFPSFKMLDINLDLIKLLLPSAFTVAMLGAIESLLSAVVADGMTGTKHDSNKELIAQGIGNIVVPFFGAIPATGAIARTAANIKNGARTRMSGIIHAIVLLLIVMVFADYAKVIPLSALAAILMVVAYNMSEITHFKKLLTAPRPDAIVLVVTFLATVFLDLTIAVGLGIVLAALLFIKRASDISIIPIEENVMAGTSGSKLLHESLYKYPQISLYEISGPMFFGVASILQERIDCKAGGVLIIRMKHVGVIDATALHALEMIISRIKQNHGQVILATVQERLIPVLEKAHIIEHLGGREFVIESSTKAVEKAKEIIHQK